MAIYRKTLHRHQCQRSNRFLFIAEFDRYLIRKLVLFSQSCTEIVYIIMYRLAFNCDTTIVLALAYSKKCQAGMLTFKDCAKKNQE